MTDPMDPVEIDVRSPGERWAESGRDGLGRMHESVQPHALVIAATAWMLATVVFLGTQVWQAFDFASSFPNDSEQTWTRLGLLAQTGSPFLSMLVLVGLGLALIAGTSRSRGVSYLGAVLGAWAALAGILGIVVAVHNENGDAAFSSGPGNNRLVEGLNFGAYAVMGAVVFWLGMTLAQSRGAADQDAEVS